MGLPASKTDIANMALGYVGHPRVNSIDPATTETELLLALHYDAVRQHLLRQFVWNCSVAYGTCTRIGTPSMQFADKYQLPNDFVRLLWVGESEENQKTRYSIQGRTICLDYNTADSLPICYIKDEEDVTVWDAGFRMVMVLSLALAVAYQLTKKEKIVERIDSLLAIELKSAVSIDGQEQPPFRDEKSQLLWERMSQSDSSDLSMYVIFED